MTLEDLARQLPRLQQECKALWGEELIDFAYVPNDLKKSVPKFSENYTIPVWKLRLQQMVIATDPIAYLGENL